MGSIHGFTLWCAIAVACVWATLTLSRAPDPRPRTVAQVAPPDVAPPELDPPVARRAAAPPQLARRPPGSGDRAIDPRRRPAGFDEFVERLVGLGVRAHAAITGGDSRGGGARRIDSLDAAARALLEQLRDAIPNADEKALGRLVELRDESGTTSARVRRRVLARILGDGLAERWRRYDAFGESRRAADALVSAMLAAVPTAETLAEELGLGLLSRKPFLGAAHEEAVLALADAAESRPFVAPVASELLSTLWSNLERTGDRRANGLASLALLFKDDANASRRFAALTYLLTAGGGRFRDLVADRVLAAKDLDLARRIAHEAARELEPTAALSMLERLVEFAGSGLTGAFLILGGRDRALLARTLRERSTTPALRAELVSGIGFDGDPGALELAMTAFEQDPDREVRERAMFVLTAHGSPSLGERVLSEALDDPRLEDDPGWIGAVALALQNIARSGDVDAARRVAQRLIGHPNLAPGDRATLEAFLAQRAPGDRR